MIISSKNKKDREKILREIKKKMRIENSLIEKKNKKKNTWEIISAKTTVSPAYLKPLR